MQASECQVCSKSALQANLPFFIHQPHPSTSAACTINIGTAAAKAVVERERERERILFGDWWLASNLFIHHHHHQSCRMFAAVSQRKLLAISSLPSYKLSEHKQAHMKQKHSQAHLCIPLVLPAVAAIGEGRQRHHHHHS